MLWRDNLREQTKAIKDILKSEYPINKFRLKYVEASNYVYGSDKVIVTCDKDICIDDVIKLLKEYTFGIKVYKQGSLESLGGNFDARIYTVDMKSYVDADAMEFIEVSQ